MARRTVPIILAIMLLYFLRMVPALGHKIEFRFDRAFNYRMTVDVIRNGDVPEIDPLSTYPQGKNIKALLPTGMYRACAAFYRAVNLVKRVPLRRAILYFCAFCGALIFIPAYFMSYEMYRSKPVAYLSGFLAGIIPAYLHRTVCYWYRYEVIGAVLLFASLAFFIKAFGEAVPKKAALHSAISAVFMIMALSAWRLSVVFLTVYLIAFLYVLLRHGADRVKSRLIFIIGIAAPFLFFLKISLAAGGSSLAYDYGSFPKAAVQIILNSIGIKQDFAPFTRLIYSNTELGGVGLAGVFGRMFLSLSGFFAVFYFIAYFRKKERNAQKDVLFVFLAVFLALTLVFSRNKILLGPLAAVTVGESFAAIFKCRKRFKIALLCVAALILLKTMSDSYFLASTRYPRNTQLRPNFKPVLKFINDEMPDSAVILSYWSDGYPIQTYCARPTITDGLFESREIVKRIIELSRIYYGYNEYDLLGFCKKYGATHVLVPKNRMRAYAGYAGVDFGDYYSRKGPSARGQATTLCKLVYRPDEIKKFELIFENKEYMLYRVK